MGFRVTLGIHESAPITGILTGITRLAVLVFLVSSMSEIGLGLTLQQILAPLRNARFVLLALIANFVLTPLLAVGIARLLRLDEPFARGLSLLGCAAGAPFLPKLSWPNLQKVNCPLASARWFC
jgi:predicted Na+-dependent transporter